MWNLHLVLIKYFSNNQDRKCWMKCCLIHEMLGCIYDHLVLEVGLRDLDNSFHISYLYVENFWYGLTYGRTGGVYRLAPLTEKVCVEF